MLSILCRLGFSYLAASFLSLSLPQIAHATEWDRPVFNTLGLAPDVSISDYALFEDVPPASHLRNESVDARGIGLDRREAKDFYLRIMPLGASITQGQASSDNNGYRKALRQQLRWKGWKVNMVGSRRHGDMQDRDHEGWNGYTVEGVHSKFNASAHLKPNLVLINAGTNDCGEKGTGEGIGAKMASMIDTIFDKIDGVSIVLTTLAPKEINNACASSVSQQYRDLIGRYSAKRIVLADWHSALTLADILEGTHPTDQGYRKIAAIMWDAIRKLEGVIQSPLDNGADDDSGGGGGDSKCEKVAGNAKGPVQTQRGSGDDDGNYIYSSTAMGNLTSVDPWDLDTKSLPSHVMFANIVKGDPNAGRAAALDDYIRIRKTEENAWDWSFYMNKGNGIWGLRPEDSFLGTPFNPGQNCNPDNAVDFQFADFDGDGLDDFFCIRQKGAVFLSWNQGGNPPTFQYAEQIIGATSDWDETGEKRVQFADIDGDGRADFCILGPNDVKCSRNGGQKREHFWQGFESNGGRRDVVFKAKSGMAVDRMFLGDINGDFRADFMYISNTGAVETWINQRGRGRGIVPSWRSAGVTHVGQAGQVPDAGRTIKFGKVYGSNRLDYIYLKKNNDDWMGYDVYVWKNQGSGGTKRKGDGSFYCDMTGSGSDDLVWIFNDGHAKELDTNIHNPPLWGHDIQISLNVPGPRVGIHLADWTGNGRCDVIVQDKSNSILTIYENQYEKGQTVMNFKSPRIVNNFQCDEGWGVGIFDRGLRLADLDGDGRTDIICLEQSGTLRGYLNKVNGIHDIGQIKFAEAWDRANLRFADVENSGRADIIWLNKYTGAGTVYKNNGFVGAGKGPGGSSFTWTNRGILYAPIDRGEVMNFANLGGLGRADLIQVYPETNVAYTNFNECDGSGGDDGPINDPGLPPYETPGNGPGNSGNPNGQCVCYLQDPEL